MPENPLDTYDVPRRPGIAFRMFGLMLVIAALATLVGYVSGLDGGVPFIVGAFVLLMGAVGFGVFAVAARADAERPPGEERWPRGHAGRR